MNVGLLLRGHIFAYLIRVLRLSTRPQLCVPHPQPRVHTFIFPYFCISVFPHRRTSHFCAPVVRVLLLPHSRARVLAPMRPAPGPGPLPCTHAPSARSRPAPSHPCARSRPAPSHPCARSRPVPLLPCARRPVPARSLAPMRPAPASASASSFLFASRPVQARNGAKSA